jgi:16S rRNA (guanine527-N7)-methyltransferase
VAASLSEQQIARELVDYQVELSAQALGRLRCYLELLLRWNRRINLTGLGEPRAIVRQLFGESLWLATVVELEGWLVDVGSGAGFPGLALKLAAPDLRVTLVESRQKKGTFLKEVVRSCQFTTVDVVVERFGGWLPQGIGAGQPNLITTRAVRMDEKLLGGIALALGPYGKALFLSTPKLAQDLESRGAGFRWDAPLEIPGGKGRVVVIGSLQSK